MKTNYFLPIMLAASLLFNCKGKQGDPGPAVATGPMLTEETKEGYIKATFATNVEGKPTTFNLDFQGAYSNGSTYFIVSDTLTFIRISKIYAKDGEVLKFGHMNINIQVSNLISLSKAKISDLFLSAHKELSPIKLLYINASGNLNNNSMEDRNSVFTLTDLKYNPTNNLLEGKFSATLKDSNYNNGDGSSSISTSTITNGSFSTKLIQEIYNTRKSN